MTTPPGPLVWVTRGRTWGFRFLLDGGFADPLPTYERAFAGAGDEPAIIAHREGSLALRFLAPEGRQDQARRDILHEVVVLGDSTGIETVQHGVDAVWPLLAETYARVWEEPAPPSRADLGVPSG